MDVEIFTKTPEDPQFKEKKYTEVYATVVLDLYSEFLLKNQERKEEIIEDFTALDRLRPWLWEVYLRTNDGTRTDEVVDVITKQMKTAAMKYDMYLYLAED